MQLNHLGVVVSDVLGAFLETPFGLEVIGKRSRKMTPLRDEGGLILSLVEGEPETMPIGFMQETEARVNEIYKRLRADGFEVKPPQRSHG